MPNSAVQQYTMCQAKWRGVIGRCPGQKCAHAPVSLQDKDSRTIYQTKHWQKAIAVDIKCVKPLNALLARVVVQHFLLQKAVADEPANKGWHLWAAANMSVTHSRECAEC
jgi:hypothetical protein